MEPIQHASPTSAICVEDLWKRYDGIEAIRGMSFEVAAGEIFGLLGPNGAGKTTTLECILGLRRPDDGSIRIGGLDSQIHAMQVNRCVGAQIQAATLQDKITPRQALRLFASFYANPFGEDELLERFRLEEKADEPFDSLSGGQRQLLFLALALINRPTVLVLDEPTAGLDPQARRELHELIREIRSEGRTVLLSTHYLDEAGQLCDRIGIMERGRIITVAPPAELIGRSRAPARLIVRTARPLTPDAIRDLPEITGVVSDPKGWVLETHEPNRALAGLVRRLDEAGNELQHIELHRPSLEDVFIELTGREWSDEDSRGEDS